MERWRDAVKMLVIDSYLSGRRQISFLPGLSGLLMLSGLHALWMLLGAVAEVCFVIRRGRFRCWSSLDIKGEMGDWGTGLTVVCDSSIPHQSTGSRSSSLLCLGRWQMIQAFAPLRHRWKTWLIKFQEPVLNLYRPLPL